MLLTFQGYFEAGRFVADTPVPIPEGKRTIVTVLEGEPERVRFRTPEEIDAL